MFYACCLQVTFTSNLNQFSNFNSSSSSVLLIIKVMLHNCLLQLYVALALIHKICNVQWFVSSKRQFWNCSCTMSPVITTIFFSFSQLRTNLGQRNAPHLLQTAFPWGETANHPAARAAITVPSASVGSSELSVTAEWATRTAAKGGAGPAPSRQNQTSCKTPVVDEQKCEGQITCSLSHCLKPAAWMHFNTEDCRTVKCSFCFLFFYGAYSLQHCLETYNFFLKGQFVISITTRWYQLVGKGLAILLSWGERHVVFSPFICFQC